MAGSSPAAQAASQVPRGWPPAGSPHRAGWRRRWRRGRFFRWVSARAAAREASSACRPTVVMLFDIHGVASASGALSGGPRKTGEELFAGITSHAKSESHEDGKSSYFLPGEGLCDLQLLGRRSPRGWELNLVVVSESCQGNLRRMPGS